MLHVIKDFGAINLDDVVGVIADYQAFGVNRSPALSVYMRDSKRPFVARFETQEEAQAEGDRLVAARNALQDMRPRMVTTPKGDGILADKIVWLGVEGRSRAGMATFAVVIGLGDSQDLEFELYADRESAEAERDRIIADINGF